MFLYKVAVGFTTHRPVRPDERTHTVTLTADTDVAAIRGAAQWVASRPGVEMVTSTEIIELEL